MSEKLLEVQNLQKYFPVRSSGKKTFVKAVDGMNFHIDKGETFGLVGESGCGKSTAGRAILRLHEPTGGKIIYDNKDITHVNMKEYRKKMQIIFQDPYSSLNPRMTVGDIVAEPIDIQHPEFSKKDRINIVEEQLSLVGLNSDHMNRYPHEFSGGQRQRISIARALAIKPEFIVCDEPISALDVSIQAQVVNMLVELQQKLGLTYLFIAHDLSVVKYISNRIGVMYLGNLVELTSASDLHVHPVHPYTRALLSAIPIPDPKVSDQKHRMILEGDVPSPINPPSGCTFRTRCPFALEKCAQTKPPLVDIGGGHLCACLRVGEI